MQLIDPYVGTYFSKAWIKKKVLNMNEEEVEMIKYSASVAFKK